MTGRTDNTPNVIVTGEGETIKETDPRFREELVERRPEHTWMTKAFQLNDLANRRRAIIRRLIKRNSLLRDALGATATLLGAIAEDVADAAKKPKSGE